MNHLHFTVLPKKTATNFLSFLRLRSFAARSALEISEALPKLRSLGASEFVIDLRGNGGIRFFPIDFVGFDESIYDTNIYIYLYIIYIYIYDR